MHGPQIQMEKYFSQPEAAKLADSRPELHFQVGSTPGGTEARRILIDRDMQSAARSLPEGHRPTTPSGPDPKWRFFWRIGERPMDGKFAELNADPVVPVGAKICYEAMCLYNHLQGVIPFLVH